MPSCRLLMLLLAISAVAGILPAQTETGTLEGQVTDPSGAAIPGAAVRARGPARTAKNITTDRAGRYRLLALPAGTYTVRITSSGFQPFQSTPVEVGRARAETLNAQLTVQTETERITVSDINTGLSVDATQNVGQIVLREDDPDAFSGDPYDFANRALTARNPYLVGPTIPDYKQERFIGNFAGPHSKRASFFMGADRHSYLAPLVAQQRPSTGVQILGTQYSSRLLALISKIEKNIGRKIIFKAKVGEENDNSIIRDGDTFVINLGPGSVEDDVAHELMHAQLESEGYPHLFCLAAIPVAKVIETFISSDFDHLIINQRLFKEGYNPLLGFMSGMRDQYKSVMTVRLPSNSTPEQRVAYDVLILHELMKHVYYVRSAAAETAILGSHPEIRPRWSPLKSAIEEYIGKPDFRHAWKFAETYLRLC